jgi:hypothetical protein
MRGSEMFSELHCRTRSYGRGRFVSFESCYLNGICTVERCPVEVYTRRCRNVSAAVSEAEKRSLISARCYVVHDTRAMSNVNEYVVSMTIVFACGNGCLWETVACMNSKSDGDGDAASNAWHPGILCLRNTLQKRCLCA